jgi:hypothetical protein
LHLNGYWSGCSCSIYSYSCFITFSSQLKENCINPKTLNHFSDLATIGSNSNHLVYRKSYPHVQFFFSSSKFRKSNLLRRISEPPPATTTPVNNYCWRILHSQLQGEISYVLFSSPFQQHCRQLRSLDSEHDSNYMGTTLRKKDEDPLPPA